MGFLVRRWLRAGARRSGNRRQMTKPSIESPATTKREDESIPSADLRGDSPCTVSVVIPAYNAVAYITEALDSVLAQTFTDFEIIVVNDGSPDTEALERVLEPYQARVTYLRQDNRGPAAARNTGIRHARGQYVAFLDADDLWNPQYLDEQLRAFRNDRTLDLIYADAELFGDSLLAGQTFMKSSPSRGAVTFASLLAFECTVLTSCAVVRRHVLISAGLFDEDFSYAEDFELWARLAHGGGKLAYQRRVLGRHRLHASSLTADEARLCEGQCKVFEKLARTLPVSAQEREELETLMQRAQADWFLEQCRRQLAAGKFREAAEALEHASEVYHSGKLRVLLFGLRTAPGLLRRVYEWRRGVRARRAVKAGRSQGNAQTSWRDDRLRRS